jgi:hypothetical protein
MDSEERPRAVIVVYLFSTFEPGVQDVWKSNNEITMTIEETRLLFSGQESVSPGQWEASEVRVQQPGP